MKRLLPLAKNPWLLAGAGVVSTYALIGFLLIPFLVEHYAPPIAAEKIKRQVSIGAAHFNPFLFKFALDDFTLKEADGQPILALRRLLVDFEMESVFRQAWVFGELALDGANVNVVVDKEGKNNLARIANDLPVSDDPPPPPGPPPRFLLKHLALKDGAVAYTRQGGTETLSPLNLDLNQISTLPENNSIHELDAELDDGGKIHWDGHFSLEPIQAEGVFRMEGFNLSSAWKLLHDRLNLSELEGSLNLAAHYKFGLQQDKVDLTLSKLGFKFSKLHVALADTTDAMLNMDNIQLDEAEFDLASRKVKLPNFAIENGQITVAIDAQGTMNWQNILVPEPEAASPTATSPTPEPPPKEAPPWQVELGAFKLADLALAYADASSRVPFAASIGRVGLDFGATAEVGAGEPKVGVHGLKLAIQDIKIAETGPSAAPDPLFTLSKFQLDKAEFDLSQHSIKLPSWDIEKGLVHVALDEQGALNWLHLTKPEKPGSPPPEPAGTAPKDAAPAAAWRLELGAFKLAELGIHYADASRKRPYTASIGGIGLDLAATAEVGAGEPKAHVDGLKLAVADIKLNDSGKAVPLLGLDSLGVGGGRLDLEKHDLAIDKIELKGGGVQIQRGADGTIGLAELFAPKTSAKAVPVPAPATKGKAAPDAPWHVALKGFALQGFRLAFVDQSFTPALAYDADSIDVNLNSINYPGKTPLSFDGKIKLKQGGLLNLTGKASPAGDSADAKVQADKLNLTPLQPIVSQFAKLKLDSADFSSNLQVGFRQNSTGAIIKTTGTLGVGRLMLKEVEGGQRLLSWKNLAVTGIDFGLKPDHLTIKEVRVQEPGTKIAIAKDKSNNFAAAFKAQPASNPAPVQPQAVVPPDKKPQKVPAPATDKPFQVKVERVRLDDGIIDFSDMSLVIPFATRVHDFDGSATDVSTVPKSRTGLKFAGRVEQFGEAKVDGSIIPTAFKTYSDVKVVFRNVEMSSLSPYSATFAGRKITSGKLSLDLLYKIEDSKLKSENKILLEQFTLGEQVESPGATSLPLDLAIALLKDGNGKISASVPIEGDVDNPKFAIGPVIWDAFVTLIKTAVTAPFRAMGSLLGVEQGEDLGAVLFQPGTDALAPPEREKIQKIVKALGQRPTLNLTVQGGFDNKLDGEALRALRIRQALGRKLGDENPDGADILSFSNAKTQKALEELAAERGGDNFLDDVQAEFEKSAGRKPSRVAGVSSLLGRASEDQDFYDKAYRHLVETEPLADKALEGLAELRAQAVLKELKGQPGFDPTRAAAGKVESVSEAKDGAVPTKMELGARE